MTSNQEWLAALIERLEAEGFEDEQIGYIVGEIVMARAQERAVIFGVLGMAESIRRQHFCRCDEYYAWCAVHDTCPRCQDLLES